MSSDGRTELRPGRYFGAVGGRLDTPLAVVSEVIHPAPRALPEHDHALAYFCMLVHGGYAETIAGRALDYAPFEVGFHPARMPHRDRVGLRGARFLCLEIRPRSLDAVALRLDTRPALLPGDVTLQMARLWQLGEYVHKLRVRSACARMSTSDEPLAAIAAHCGFADQSHFCRVFKALVGRAPSAFRAALPRHGVAPPYSM